MTVTLFSNDTLAATPAMPVFALHTELVRGTEAQWMEELTPRARRESMTLDLSAVERIDAAGIAMLITLYCTSIEAGKSFSVVNPSSHVLELLRIVGLESILIADCQPGGSGVNCLDPTDKLDSLDRPAAA